MNRARSAAGLGPRLFLAQGLVVLAGATTLVVVLFLVAPGLFHSHLDRALGGVPRDLAAHVDRAFESAVLLSLAAAVAASLLTTMGVSWFLTRRLTRPVQELADAADRIAAGNYAIQIPDSGLGAEFDRLDAAFNTMSAELASTEQRRRALLADLAHELRTPIATLDGFLEGLEDGVVSADPDTWRILRDQTARLRRLVEDVNHVSQAEERPLVMATEAVDLTDLAGAAVEAAERRFHHKGVVLHLDATAGALTVGDPDRLWEVLDNLLDNALRHTPTGGRVTVTVQPSHHIARVSVTDTGQGIDGRHLPHVFDRFYRADSARVRGSAGSGIGLAIARALVHAHGGTITVHSDGPGTGSRFVVELPRRPANQVQGAFSPPLDQR